MKAGDRFGFIGCGRVGRTLAQAFSSAGRDVAFAWSRDEASATLMRSEVPGLRTLDSAQAVADACTHVFLTVSDDAIEPLASSIEWAAHHRVVHCSGATELAALDAARQSGALAGGFHPLQMFTDPGVALRGLPGCVVGIEADGALEAELQRLAIDIGCKSVRVPAGDRGLYHASAYYVGPFLIALLSEGAALWKKFGAGEKQALDALLPLLAGTLAAVDHGGLAQGMGGCVARGDIGTVRKHVSAIAGFSPDAAALYRALAMRTIPLGIARGTLSEAGAEAIADALDERRRFP